MTREQELLQSILSLTEDDLMLWDYDTQGYYNASCDGAKFQLCCVSNEAWLFVDGERCHVGRNSVMMLCNAIAVQSIRRRKNLEGLDIVNERLKKHLNIEPTRKAQ